MANETILSSPLFLELVLPFLLVFTIVFAILQKTKILGDGKKQIDAIVALVVGLITISFGYATGIIISLVPFLAVVAVIILVFMMLYGMVYADGKFEMHRGLKITFGIVVGLAVIAAVMVATGAWNFVYDLFFFESDGSLVTNIVFLVVVIVAIVAVVWQGKGDK